MDASTSHRLTHNSAGPDDARQRRKVSVGVAGTAMTPHWLPVPLDFPDTQVSCVPTVFLLTINLKSIVKHSSVTQITTVINPFMFLQNVPISVCESIKKHVMDTCVLLSTGSHNGIHTGQWPLYFSWGQKTAPLDRSPPVIPSGNRHMEAGHRAGRVPSDWWGPIWVNGFHSNQILAHSD